MTKGTLYLDIETLPAPAAYKDEIIVKPPARLSKPESIEKWMEENADAEREKLWRKTALDASRGRICCIAWQINNSPVHSVWSEDEARLLDNFFSRIENKGVNPAICGHNVLFDLEFIKRRSIIHEIRLPFGWPINKKPWVSPIRDTQYLWTGSHTEFISLDALCKILGVQGKGDVDGSMVADLWFDGQHEKVAQYCRDDVRRVYEIDQKFQMAEV